MRIELILCVRQTHVMTITLISLLARRLGLEPRLMVLETIVLPLNYQRIWLQRLGSN